ncbi:ATP-binding cassette domain-containing protein [Salinactinospora qingdaonensis]|uniref:ABC transporter n=1 Tax=Salinactinospora qingdaonensis TaxID=702744 RepID=A0ABP7GGQ8_9ACTN
MAAPRTASVRAAIGVVGPHLPLLRGTIADNVRYAAPEADGRRLHRASLDSGLDSLLAQLPLGLQTPVRENGAGLSAGQRQRAARALLPRLRLLPLDEADTNLDPAATEAMDRVIAHFTGTVIVAPHRPQRVESADVVWRLSHGVLRVEHRRGSEDRSVANRA